MLETTQSFSPEVAEALRRASSVHAVERGAAQVAAAAQVLDEVAELRVTCEQTERRLAELGLRYEELCRTVAALVGTHAVAGGRGGPPVRL